MKQDSGKELHNAGIEAAIAIGLLCDAFDQLRENSIIQEVNDIINK